MRPTLSMDSIFNYQKDKEPNYYALLGCTQLSSMEQVMSEYKVRALALHPDKNRDDPLADVKFRELQRAKETLADPTARKTYDKWLNMGLAIPFTEWAALSAGAHASFHWAPANVGRKRAAMISDGQNFSMQGTNDIVNGEHPRPNPLWQRDAGSDLLDRFRTYKI